MITYQIISRLSSLEKDTVGQKKFVGIVLNKHQISQYWEFTGRKKKKYFSLLDKHFCKLISLQDARTRCQSELQYGKQSKDNMFKMTENAFFSRNCISISAPISKKPTLNKFLWLAII